MERLEFNLTLRTDNQVKAMVRQGRKETDLPPEPLHPSDSVALVQLMDRALGGSVRQSRKDLEAIGTDLYRMIFNGEIKSAFERDAWERVRKSPQRYRLAISLTLEDGLNPKVASRPWEFLYSPYAKTFLATHPGITFVRRPVQRRGDPVYPAPVPLPAGEPLKVMLVHSSPEKLGTVALNRVKNVLEDLAGQSGRLLKPLILPEPSPETIERELADYKPHILHILAHGHFEEDGSQVALVATDGSAHWYSARSLADVFQSLGAGDLPRVLLLQACEGGQPSRISMFNPGAAAEFHPYVPAVVAMYYTITNAVGWDFSDEFYRKVVGGEDLDVAVQRGRRELARAVSGASDSHANRNFGGLIQWLRPGAQHLWGDLDNSAVDTEETALTFTIRTPPGVRLETDAPADALVHQLLTAWLAQQPPETSSEAQRYTYSLHLTGNVESPLHPADTLWEAGVRNGANLELRAELLTPESPVSLTIESDEGLRYITAVQLKTRVRYLAELFLENIGQTGRGTPRVELVSNGEAARPLKPYASLFDEGVGTDAVLRIFHPSHPEQE